MTGGGAAGASAVQAGLDLDERGGVADRPSLRRVAGRRSGWTDDQRGPGGAEAAYLRELPRRRWRGQWMSSWVPLRVGVLQAEAPGRIAPVGPLTFVRSSQSTAEGSRPSVFLPRRRIEAADDGAARLQGSNSNQRPSPAAGDRHTTLGDPDTSPRRLESSSLPTAAASGQGNSRGPSGLGLRLSRTRSPRQMARGIELAVIIARRGPVGPRRDLRVLASGCR